MIFVLLIILRMRGSEARMVLNEIPEKWKTWILMMPGEFSLLKTMNV